MNTRQLKKISKEDTLYHLPDITNHMSYDLAAGVLAGVAMSNEVKMTEAEERQGQIIDDRFESLIKCAKMGNIVGLNESIHFLMANNPLLMMLNKLVATQTARYRDNPVSKSKEPPFAYRMKANKLTRICRDVWQHELAGKVIANLRQKYDFTSAKVVEDLAYSIQNEFIEGQILKQRPTALSKFSSLFHRSNATSKQPGDVAVKSPACKC